MRELKVNYRPPLELRTDEMLQALSENGYLLSVGSALAPDKLVSLARKLGEPVKTGIGTLEDRAIIELRSDHEIANYAFTENRLVLHKDLIFYPEIPRYLMLQCVAEPETGGETLLLDGEEAAALLLQKYGENLRVNVLSYEVMHPDGTRKKEYPLIADYDGKDTLFWRDATPDNPRERIELVGGDKTQLDDLTQKVRMITHDPNLLYSHRWETGDILIVDNIRMLHGRNPFSGNRKINRINVQ